ncbi:rod shape-determining protein MreD [Ectobacillus ponti]|uniref:Rod shape-determining protein MreD n=1 Tax=Ectobacillus ponti TaxID=2961894 RepID=A0AA41X1M9_9BACI|nr:rod shape-determining protein MreD [Ectobacillus ponti]MCP8967319.1 rod shape-determining protein MreD [Ectobacillus ponti]
MKKAVLPLLLLFVFLLESIFSAIAPTNLFGEHTIVAPRFLLVVLLLITIYYNAAQGIYLACIYGLLVDIVYTELIGVYVFAYPLLAYLVSNAMRILQVNFLIVSVLVLFGVAGLEYYVYGLLRLLGRTDMAHAVFFADRLLPTLLLNGIFLVLFSFPLRKLLLRLLAAAEEK